MGELSLGGRHDQIPGVHRPLGAQYHIAIQR